MNEQEWIDWYIHPNQQYSNEGAPRRAAFELAKRDVTINDLERQVNGAKAMLATERGRVALLETANRALGEALLKQRANWSYLGRRTRFTAEIEAAIDRGELPATILKEPTPAEIDRVTRDAQSPAEDEAAETESLAHRIEDQENRLGHFFSRLKEIERQTDTIPMQVWAATTDERIEALDTEQAKLRNQADSAFKTLRSHHDRWASINQRTAKLENQVKSAAPQERVNGLSERLTRAENQIEQLRLAQNGGFAEKLGLGGAEQSAPAPICGRCGKPRSETCGDDFVPMHNPNQVCGHCGCKHGMHSMSCPLCGL